MSYACYRNLGTNRTGGVSNSKSANYKTNSSLGVDIKSTQPQRQTEHFETPSIETNVDSNIFPYQIKNINEKQEIINSHSLVIVYVYGNTCRPCHVISPKYAMMAKKYNTPNICVLVKEDADLQLSSEVNGVPFFQVYKNGKRVESLLGSFDMLESVIQKYLN